MSERFSRRGFLKGAAVTAIPLGAMGKATVQASRSNALANPDGHRVLDIHVHLNEKDPNFIHDLVTLADRESHSMSQEE